MKCLLVGGHKGLYLLWFLSTLSDILFAFVVSTVAQILLPTWTKCSRRPESVRPSQRSCCIPGGDRFRCCPREHAGCRVGSECPLQDHSSPPLANRACTFQRTRLSLYVFLEMIFARKRSCMKLVVAAQTEDQRFPVAGCHHFLPRCLPLCHIFHFPNMMDFKRPFGCSTILALACVQSFNQLRTAKRESECIGRDIDP